MVVLPLPTFFSQTAFCVFFARRQFRRQFNSVASLATALHWAVTNLRQSKIVVSQSVGSSQRKGWQARRMRLGLLPFLLPIDPLLLLLFALSNFLCATLLHTHKLHNFDLLLSSAFCLVLHFTGLPASFLPFSQLFIRVLELLCRRCILGRFSVPPGTGHCVCLLPWSQLASAATVRLSASSVGKRKCSSLHI